MGQWFYEVIWDTRPFNNKDDWPEDGSQPFVWSFGDGTGYANHGGECTYLFPSHTSFRHGDGTIGWLTVYVLDYLFGWKDDALQRALDNPCYIDCPTLKTQDAKAMNACTVPRVVEEEIDDCKLTLMRRDGIDS